MTAHQTKTDEEQPYQQPRRRQEVVNQPHHHQQEQEKQQQQRTQGRIYFLPLHEYKFYVLENKVREKWRKYIYIYSNLPSLIRW